MLSYSYEYMDEIFDNGVFVRKVTRELRYGSYADDFMQFMLHCLHVHSPFFIGYPNAIPSRTAPSLIHSSIHPIVILDFCQHLHVAIYMKREPWTHWLLLVSAKFS